MVWNFCSGYIGIIINNLLLCRGEFSFKIALVLVGSLSIIEHYSLYF